MRIIKLLILVFALSLKTVFAQENSVEKEMQKVENSYLKFPRVEVIPITDSRTERPYELYIKLPEGYSENKDLQYPVLYFTDAMWHIEILSASAEYIMENAILVGISWEKDLKGDLGALGVHASRFRDYSIKPASNPDQQAKYNLGQASNHLTFIRNDVINYVETNYRTDSDNRTYFGYSLGGEFGAYILLAQPETFKNYIIGSPTLKGNIPYFSELTSNTALKRESLNANVFISYGTLEKASGEYVDEFITLLKNRNDKSLSLTHEVIEGSHQTAFPLTGVRSVTWLASLIEIGE